MEDTPIRSLPALAAALRRTNQGRLPTSSSERLKSHDLVPQYQIAAGSPEEEVRSAVQLVISTADRLRRLGEAYAEWGRFDPVPFFDLYPEQAELLVRVSERVSTVHVTFYIDLLLPSFRLVEQTWANRFFPAYQAAHPLVQRSDRLTSYAVEFLEIEQPRLIAYWERLTSVVLETRRELQDEIGFMATAGGGEERARWRPYWTEDPAPGLDERLIPALNRVPTLTLISEFPLPPHRQPGRIRRLRRMWSQNRRRRP